MAQAPAEDESQGAEAERQDARLPVPPSPDNEEGQAPPLGTPGATAGSLGSPGATGRRGSAEWTSGGRGAGPPCRR
eukprot:4004831-Alexandrium_andersonii.AAC.1